MNQLGRFTSFYGIFLDKLEMLTNSHVSLVRQVLGVFSRIEHLLEDCMI